MRLQIADKSVIGSVRFKIETRQPRNPEKRHGVATQRRQPKTSIANGTSICTARAISLACIHKRNVVTEGICWSTREKFFGAEASMEDTRVEKIGERILLNKVPMYI